MTGRRYLPLALWFIGMVIAGVLVLRVSITNDFSSFLPAHPNRHEQLLARVLRAGPNSQTILAGIAGATPEQRLSLSRRLAEAARERSDFSLVANGDRTDWDAARQFLFDHRYLLSDAVDATHFETTNLALAMRSTLLARASEMGGVLDDALADRDPTGEMQRVIDSLDTGKEPAQSDGVWVSPNGNRALLILQLRAVGSDTDGQLAAVHFLRQRFAQFARELGAADATLTLTGPAVFAADMRAQIQQEAGRLSAWAMLLVGSILWLAYRSIRLLLLGFIPVVAGALLGLLAVSRLDEVIYGTTLGFGITLMGEAVDYAIYLFVQNGALAGRSWVHSLWPTLRLGTLTSVVGFGALLFAPFPGLSQIGLYTVVGLLTAAAVTRLVLPPLLGEALPLPPGSRWIGETLMGARALRGALLPLALASLLLLWHHRDHLFSNELSALSPISAADAARDESLRTDLGAMDVGDLMLVEGPTAQSVLQGAEALSHDLAERVQHGQLLAYDSPSRYLPSLATQRRRQDAVPVMAVLHQRVDQAAAAAGLRADRLGPFLNDVERVREQPLLDPSALAGTPLAGPLGQLLFPMDGRWIALLPLRTAPAGAHTPSAGPTAVSLPGVQVQSFNLKRESNQMYGLYASAIARLSLAGLLALLALLALTLRSAKRVLRVSAPLMLAALFVAATFAAVGAPMNLLHVIGLLLIFAVGSNYSLLLDRLAQPDAPALERILVSLVLANLTAVIAFGLLATSHVPLLAALGRTVAPGAWLALIIAAALFPPIRRESG